MEAGNRASKRAGYIMKKAGKESNESLRAFVLKMKAKENDKKYQKYPILCLSV